MQLELNDLRKTYLLPAPLLHRRGQGKPKTKQALAGVSITPRPGPVWPFGAERRGKIDADRHHHRRIGRRFGRGAMVRPPRARHCVPPHSWLYAAAAGPV